MSVRVNLRLSDDLWGLVGSRAGELGQTRTVFVVRALEVALGGEAVKQPAGQVFGVVGPSRSGEAREVEEPRPAASSSRALAPASPRAHRPERHEFASGEEWQAAMRVWKGK